MDRRYSLARAESIGYRVGMRLVRLALAYIVVLTGCYSHIRFQGTDSTGATRACVDACEHGGGGDDCLAHCPNIIVEREPCPAPSENSVCVERAHLRVLATTLAIIGATVLVGFVVVVVALLPNTFASQ
jgi:hypothetical protein